MQTIFTFLQKKLTLRGGQLNKGLCSGQTIHPQQTEVALTIYPIRK